MEVESNRWMTAVLNKSMEDYFKEEVSSYLFVFSCLGVGGIVTFSLIVQRVSNATKKPRIT